MSFELPSLPYEKDALEPHVSSETLEYHHGKHHQGYVNKTNTLTEGTAWEGKPLEEIIRGAEPGGLFNNAAQVWNHTFYWHSMKPGGGGGPQGDLADAIGKAFGGGDGFKKAFVDAAVGRFGSGWAWLVLNQNKELEIVHTLNADNPLRSGQIPLLTIDVWEHAYYIDYRNLRKKYAETFVDSLVNWDFATENFKRAGA
jgi:Fe-Mn family superoxide dismutase